MSTQSKLSFVSIRYFNIYTNGTPLIGGWPNDSSLRVCSTNCLTKN